MPINLVNAVVRVKVEWIGLRLTLIGRDIRSFSRGLVVRDGPLENLWGGGRSTKKKFAQGKIK